MTKKPDITTISSGYYSTTALNNNFTNIRDQFDNTLSLDGSTPNAMQADLDFNNNSALNVDSLEAQTLTIGGSAVSLADIQTLNGIGADIQTLADIEDGTDATDAIQTVAGISSDVTSTASNNTDISTVAGISSDVTTVAGVSSDVSTVASNVTDITNFSDVYLGPVASDPATRNDGSALQTGDLYFNTTADEVRVYDGASWVAAYVDLSGALLASNNLSDVDSASTSLSNLGLTATATELNYSDGVTSNIQTQLDGKASTSHTHTLSDITDYTAPTELSQAQVEDDTDTTFGLVSGERLSQAVTANAAGMTWLAPVATTSGTAIDVTSLPAGITEIVIQFRRVSTNGTSHILVQFGTSGGFVTTGYETESAVVDGTNTTNAETSGFILRVAGDGREQAGLMRFYRDDSDRWTYDHNVRDTNAISVGSGDSPDLGGTLTQIRLTTAGGTDTFDNGEIVIGYQ